MNHERVKKSYLFTMVFIIFVAAVLSGCGGGTSPNKNEQAASAPNKTDKASPAPEQEANFQEIEAAAKKEGKLVWYAGAAAGDMKKIGGHFMKDYPEIKVEVIDLKADQVPARVAVEHKGKLFNVDVISSSGWPMDQVERQGSLVKFKLPKDLIAGMTEGAIDPEGFWIAEYVLTFPITYNPKVLAAEGLKVPASYEDLTKPEWKGKFSMTPDNYEWYASLEKIYGADKALKLLQALAANKPVLRDGSSLNMELLQAGEFAASVHVYGYKSDLEKSKGKPVDYVNLTPTITQLQPQGVAKNAPHPNAAKLFQMWMVTKKTQQFILDDLNRTPAHKEVLTKTDVWNPTKFKYDLSDPNSGEKYTEYQKLYEKTIGAKK